MNVNDIFPSRFVKAHDLGDKEITVTVKNATMEDMGHGADKETKLCIWFERATKGFVLNKTNAMIIASMYGPETDNWKGKAITIYSARVKAFGAWHDAVRVKEQIPARNVGAAKIPDAMQETPPLDDEEDLLDVDEGNRENVQPGPSVGVDVDFGMGQPRAQNAPQTSQDAQEPHSDNNATTSTYDDADDPDDLEAELLDTWKTPADAQAWAVAIGACANIYEAQNSFKNLVNEKFGGKCTTGNIYQVHLAYMRKQDAKLEEMFQQQATAQPAQP